MGAISNRANPSYYVLTNICALCSSPVPVISGGGAWWLKFSRSPYHEVGGPRGPEPT
jgi:hypothetical protein